MLYYLRNHRYEKAQRDKIISLRARYQPLNRQMRDAEHYGGESPQAFVERKYQEFYQIHQRFPVYDRSFPDEYQLCRLYLMFGGGRYPVVEKPRTEVNTQKARCTPRRKTPEETFAEAMAFYQEHGRMPLHRKKKPGQERAAEGKLAARVTALFRANRFSDEQMRILRKLRIQNVDKPRILLDKLLQYIREHDGNAPKHTSGIAENRLLNSIKNHISWIFYRRICICAIHWTNKVDIFVNRWYTYYLWRN